MLSGVDKLGYPMEMLRECKLGLLFPAMLPMILDCFLYIYIYIYINGQFIN
ncbi:hypothetical protein K6L59_02770 [Candidatus Phytoplasma sp. Tabriz.2]|nr:hypothetical protein [Candidatus Phytoplasma australiense]